MKKIIFFSKNLNIGGMEKALVTLLNRLVKYYDVTLILEEKTGSLIRDLDVKININEYKLSTMKNTIIRKIINFTKRLKWAFFNKNKYDFSCNYATYSIIGSRLAQIASKNSCLYVHSDYYNFFSKDDKKVVDFFELHQIKSFQSVVFVSNEAVDNLKFLFPKCSYKFVVINNLIDFDSVDILSKKEDITFKKDSINLLFVGRLDNTSKNFDLLIKSFALAHGINNKLHLYLVGDGPYRDSIDMLIKQNNLLKSVSLLGEKKNPYPYIRACDCMVFTSYYEGFPITYWEALKLDKQVITTVPVSDSEIDVRDYFTIVKMNEKEIAEQMMAVNKKQKKYNINFQDLNNKNFEKFKNVIEQEW